MISSALYEFGNAPRVRPPAANERFEDVPWTEDCSDSSSMGQVFPSVLHSIARPMKGSTMPTWPIVLEVIEKSMNSSLSRIRLVASLVLISLDILSLLFAMNL